MIQFSFGPRSARISRSPVLLGVVCMLVATAAVVALAQVPMIARALASGRLTALGASAGLGVSIGFLLFGALVLRGPFAANAVKFCSMALLIVSLGVLVGACNGGAIIIGGTVTGLPSTSTLTITDTANPNPTTGNGLATIMGDGSFTLYSNFPSGSSYAIELDTTAGVSCSVTSGSGNGTPTQSISLGITCAPTYTITGTVTGLAVSTILTITDSDNSNPSVTNGLATVSGAGSTPISFTLYDSIDTGTAYNVVLTVPPGQNCSITSGAGSGTISANVTLGITCSSVVTGSTITGTVTGLATGTSLTITDTDNTNRTTGSGLAVVTGAGVTPVPFTLYSSIASGTAYDATLTPPSGQNCSVSSGGPASGTISGNVTLGVTCSAVVIDYTMTGTVTGLASGTNLIITDSDNSNPTANDGTVTVTGDGSTAVDFTLYSSLASGTAYNLMLTPPSEQTCAFGSSSPGSGTISADVSLSVTCSATVTASPLSNPGGLAFYYNRLFVANGGANQVLVYNEQLGSGNVLTGMTLSTTITAGINNPSRLAFDGSGNLYVANYGNNTVTVYGPDLQQITGAAITTGITTPLGLAVDQDGDVYVGNNSLNSISVFTGSASSGGFSLDFTTGGDGNGDQYLSPGVITYAAVGPNDDLFIGTGPGGSPNLILSYDVAVGPLGIQSDPIGDVTNSGCTIGPSGPTGIAVLAGSSAATSTVYITDYYAADVEAYSYNSIVNGGILGPECETPTAVSGSNSQIASPEGVAVDSFGNVFVSNSSSNTITVYNPITAAPIYTQH